MAGQKPGGRRSSSTKQGPVRPGSPTARPATASKRPAAGKAATAGPGRPDAARSASAAGNRDDKSPATANGATAVAAGTKPGSGAKAKTAAIPAAGPARVPARGLGALLSPFRSMGALPLVTFILSLYGLGASIYLTIAHYDTHISLICSDKGLINCEEVTTSSQSMVFGIFPVAVLGLAFYVFMVAINSPWGWRLSLPAVRWLRLGSVIAGMGFVLYLIYAELDQIHAICLWCTSVHVATFLIFALLIFHAAFSWETPAARGDRRVP
ncbi:MAG TPA: vitamin K epoxide reductase family protein [Streptosporangiaceae bacterium]|nr:vitamin K epoxide reductase family protein [Streptosporangiaceae bacterium]